MSKKANPTLVGAFVVSGLLLAVVAVFLLGGGELFHKKHPFIMFFEGDVNGLAVGARVKFQGVQVGSVTSVRLRLTPEGATTIIPVTILLDESLIESRSGVDVTWGEAGFQRTIDQGMRARLETESFVTGQRYVALFIDPRTPPKLLGLAPDMNEIPTVPATLEEVRRVLDQLKDVDFRGMVDDLGATSRAVRELLSSPKTQAIPASLEQTLRSIDELARSLQAQVQPISTSVTNTSEAVQHIASELETTLDAVRPALDTVRETAQRAQRLEDDLAQTLATARALMDPDAPLVVQLQATLQEFGATARSLRTLAELVERDPGALLRGKDVPRKP